MQEPIVSVLGDRRSYLETIITNKEKALVDVPEGRVRCKMKRGKPEYYWVIRPDTVTGKYLSVRKTDLAKRLAQKMYDKEVLKIAKEELKRVNSLEKFREEHDLNSIYEEYNDVRRLPGLYGHSFSF